LDENLKSDHDFMALLINIQQSSAAQPVTQPSASRGSRPYTTLTQREAKTESESSEESSSSPIPTTSRKGKALKVKFKDRKKKKKASSKSSKYRNSSNSSSSNSSVDSSEKEMPKKKKEGHYRNFSSVKSEMDALMRKSKLALTNGKKGIFPICFPFFGALRNFAY
jgi:hypothetical protein